MTDNEETPLELARRAKNPDTPLAPREMWPAVVALADEVIRLHEVGEALDGLLFRASPDGTIDGLEEYTRQLEDERDECARQVAAPLLLALEGVRIEKDECGCHCPGGPCGCIDRCADIAEDAIDAHNATGDRS